MRISVLFKDQKHNFRISLLFKFHDFSNSCTIQVPKLLIFENIDYMKSIDMWKVLTPEKYWCEKSIGSTWKVLIREEFWYFCYLKNTDTFKISIIIFQVRKVQILFIYQSINNFQISKKSTCKISMSTVCQHSLNFTYSNYFNIFLKPKHFRIIIKFFPLFQSFVNFF